MINPRFQPPTPDVSRMETERRIGLLPWIQDYFDEVTAGIFVCGSLSYGGNYSVTSESDIDVHLVIDEESIDHIERLDLYEKSELTLAIAGYRRGIYKQFSLTGLKEGIQIESHFWNKQAFISAVAYQNVMTPRLRSTVATASTDYGFSFDGTIDTIDFYGEIIDGYPVSDFPSYRIVNSKLYLCRPITNILGGPIVLKTDADFELAFEKCWQKTVDYLKHALKGDGCSLSVVNALPSQYKMSAESKALVNEKAEVLMFS